MSNGWVSYIKLVSDNVKAYFCKEVIKDYSKLVNFRLAAILSDLLLEKSKNMPSRTGRPMSWVKLFTELYS